jgi:glycosyltransferase involved in cell wall biosynthesis
MRRPKVSVGLPVYNGERFLVNALTRLLEQDFEDFELIISDNASTDKTAEICRQFVERDRRIRYVRNSTNIGLGANHNRTFELSRGEFFKWVAHDDDYPPGMLGRLVETLEDSPPRVGLVYSWCEYIDEYGNIDGVDSDGVDLDDPWPHRRLAYLLQRVHMYNSPFGLMRADVLRRTRLHGLYPKADHVLLGELAMLSVFVEVREPLLRIRRHPGRTFTANKTAKALREIFTPGRGARFLPVTMRTKMAAEIVRSAMLIPPLLRDKVLCTAVALTVPQWRTFRAFGGRQKQKIFGLLSTTPAGAHRK